LSRPCRHEASHHQGTNLDEFLSDLDRYAAVGALTPQTPPPTQTTADTLRRYLGAGLIVPDDLCEGDDGGYAQHLLTPRRPTRPWRSPEGLRP